MRQMQCIIANIVNKEEEERYEPKAARRNDERAYRV